MYVCAFACVYVLLHVCMSARINIATLCPTCMHRWPRQPYLLERDHSVNPVEHRGLRRAFRQAHVHGWGSPESYTARVPDDGDVEETCYRLDFVGFGESIS